MPDLTPAEQAIFHTYGQEDTERTRAIVAAVRPHIAAEVLREAAEEIETAWPGAAVYLRQFMAKRIEGGSDVA